MMIDIDLLLAYGAAYKRLVSGEIVFKEGTPCSFYHQVVSGQVRWVNINDEGKEYLQTLVEVGESFGELPLFDGEPYAATAIANRDAVVIRLHQSTFHQLLKEHPEIHFEFSKLLTSRLRFKFMLVKEVAIHEPEKRIMSLLSYMKAKCDHICPHCAQIKLTRQQIADMTGLRVETVIRVMRHLHEKGVIQIQKGKVYFSNMTEVISKRCTT